MLLFCQHGALWLANRATGELAARARALAGRLWPFVLLVAAVFLAASAVFTNLYANYLAQPVLWLLPLFAVLALVLTRVYLARGRTGLAWVASAKTIAFCTFFGVAGLYPNLLPSSLDPAASLTIHNAASSQLTLAIMLGVALVMVPIVIVYQAWAYRFFLRPGAEEEPY